MSRTAFISLLALLLAALAPGSSRAMLIQVVISDADIAELRKDAESGDVDAQYQLGFIYSSFCLTCAAPKPDAKEALKWLRLAADKGDADSQAVIGAMYMKAPGLQDPD